MSSVNVMLSSVEHEKGFKTLEAIKYGLNSYEKYYLSFHVDNQTSYDFIKCLSFDFFS